MKRPRPRRRDDRADRDGRHELQERHPRTGQDHRQRQGQLDPQHDLPLGVADATRRVHRVRLERHHARVGVAEQRRQRERHQCQQQGPERRADAPPARQVPEQDDQAEARDRPADVHRAARQERAAAEVRQQQCGRHGEGRRDEQRQHREPEVLHRPVRDAGRVRPAPPARPAQPVQRLLDRVHARPAFRAHGASARSLSHNNASTSTASTMDSPIPTMIAVGFVWSSGCPAG